MSTTTVNAIATEDEAITVQEINAKINSVEEALKMGVNYVAEYYKTEEHNFAEFFDNWEKPTEVLRLKNEIKRLAREISKKTDEINFLTQKSYNNKFISAGKVCISYTDGKGKQYYYDIDSGLPMEDLEEGCTPYEITKKRDDVDIVIGYCPSSIAVVIRSYFVTISSNYAKMSITFKSEKLLPFFDNKMYICDANGEKSEYDTDTSYMGIALKNVKADDFLNIVYGINRNYHGLTLYDAFRGAKNNKGFEVIVKTAEEIDVKRLLEENFIKSGPIYRMLNIDKNIYEWLIEKGMLQEFLDALSHYRALELHAGDENKGYREGKDLIDLLEKCSAWEGDLDFYQIRYTNYDTKNLFETLIDAYSNLGRKQYGRYGSFYFEFYKYYPLGKFCSYVVNESINQGFSSIKTFIEALGDYLRMCSSMDITPILESSYLRQTHDITSRNHKIKLAEEQEVIFKNVYKDYKHITKINGTEYVIVAPESCKDIQREGDTLNHCVASYIKRILDGETIIVFLRLENKPNDSLVTIEIRNGSICQARGRNNREMNAEELKAIKIYAGSNKLEVRV